MKGFCCIREDHNGPNHKEYCSMAINAQKILNFLVRNVFNSINCIWDYYVMESTHWRYQLPRGHHFTNILQSIRRKWRDHLPCGNLRMDIFCLIAVDTEIATSYARGLQIFCGQVLKECKELIEYRYIYIECGLVKSKQRAIGSVKVFTCCLSACVNRRNELVVLYIRNTSLPWHTNIYLVLN